MPLRAILSVNRWSPARAALHLGLIAAETAGCVVTFGKPLIYRKGAPPAKADRFKMGQAGNGEKP
jgi:hypothetical protein